MSESSIYSLQSLCKPFQKSQKMFHLSPDEWAGLCKDENA